MKPKHGTNTKSVGPVRKKEAQTQEKRAKSRSARDRESDWSREKELQIIPIKSEGYLTLSTNSTEGGGNSNGVAVVVNCFVKWIKFQTYHTQKSYVMYELKVRARTKHMKSPEYKDGTSEFTLFTRYSELLRLREKLEQVIKTEMQRRGNDMYLFKLGFPRFPPKRVYQKSDHSFIEKRMFAMELYFEELFD